jgi:uncharacterized Zn finger protein
LTLYDSMVHYDPTVVTAHRHPPTCPKCGSHKTQIVGLSKDGQTVVVRCNSCGERSEVKAEADARPSDEERVPIVESTRVADWQHT